MGRAALATLPLLMPACTNDSRPPPASHSPTPVTQGFQEYAVPAGSTR